MGSNPIESTSLINNTTPDPSKHMHSTQEPLFYIYDRNSVSASSQRDALTASDLFSTDPVEILRGWNNVDSYIDECLSNGTNVYWVEVGRDRAPVKMICEECNRTTKSNSTERIEFMKRMHKLASHT